MIVEDMLFALLIVAHFSITLYRIQKKIIDRI